MSPASLLFVGTLACHRYWVAYISIVMVPKNEGAGPAEANALGKRGGWSGRAWQRASAILHHSLRADRAWNGRRVNCPGLLLGPACTPLLAVGRLFARSANFLAIALACEDILCQAYLLQVVSVRLKVSNPKANSSETDGLSDGFGAETPAKLSL